MADGRIRCVVPNPGLGLGVTPTIPITDVAAFAPTFTAAVGEPGGWAVVGLPANLVGPSAPVVVDGTLLGAAVEVRFTPVSWRWGLGDDGTVVHDVGGATWSASGLPEFSPTATSHVFRSPGPRTVSLAVVVAAEYRVAGGAWVPVIGTLTLPVAGFDLVVVTADTVLVDRDCARSPTGPGC